MRFSFLPCAPRSHPFSTRQGPTTKSSTQFMVFLNSQERDENDFVMGVAIKLIITEFATVNTVIECLLKSNIHWLSLKINDVFYIPFSPNVLREPFCTRVVLSSAHQLCWLQQGNSTSLRNHRQMLEHSPKSKPSTSQLHNQLIHSHKTFRVTGHLI